MVAVVFVSTHARFIVRLQIPFCFFQVSSHYFSPMLPCPVFHQSVDDCAQVVKCFSPFRYDVIKAMKRPAHRRWANVEPSKQRTCACWLKLLLSAVVCVLFDNSRGNQGPHNSWNDNAFARFQLKSFCSKYNVLMQLWLWNIAYEWSTFPLSILFRKIVCLGTTCPFPASVACWRVWSILH